MSKIAHLNDLLEANVLTEEVLEAEEELKHQLEHGGISAENFSDALNRRSSVSDGVARIRDSRASQGLGSYRDGTDDAVATADGDDIQE